MGALAETDFKSAHAGQMLESHERRHHILELRRRGMTYAQIAETLGNADSLKAAGLNWDPIQVTAGSCSSVVRLYLRKLEAEEAESRDELRQLENQRLDAMYRKWITRQDSADPTERARAAAVLLKISDRRAKLNGLDAPTRVSHQVTGSIMHELGIDPDELAREQESFVTAFGDVTLDEKDILELPSGEPSPEDS